MKTIELKAGQQIAQFTTKSVTFDGKGIFLQQNVESDSRSRCMQILFYI